MDKNLTSETVLQHNRRYIPGGISSVNRNIDPAITFVRGEGAYLWDNEGKRYIDYHAGFAAVNVVPAMLLFALLAGTISFWFSPLVHFWSRRFEYEADAFARESMGDAQPLVQALRKLTEKNLSNLTPHPLYSGFYYSHPTLLERERALRTGA